MMKFLGVYWLSTAGLIGGQVLPSVLAVQREVQYCAYEPNQIVSDACASYATLENMNNKARPLIQDLTQNTDFFKYYRLNLFGKECPFWDDNSGTCGNRACAVDVLEDEKDIPEIWRAKELGKLAGPKAAQPRVQELDEEDDLPLGGALGLDTSESCIFESDEVDERDYCIGEDESSGSDGVYVSLVANPERFTGYGGESAHNIWNAVYRENCFVKPSAKPKNTLFAFPGTRLNNQEVAAVDLKQVLEKKRHELILQNRGLPQIDDECMEKRVFYRIISGMHASISMHLCWDYLNTTTGTWGPNLQCYIDRIHNHPERIQNLYFNYALVMRAVAKLKTHLQTYTFCSGDPDENRITKAKILSLSERAGDPPPIFDETAMFKDAPSLKEDFRNRFRNVSRIMDCVGCDKCRLWGKVQTSGLGTALKILFEFDEKAGGLNNPRLRRTELVALVNTLDKLSASLVAAANFSKMVEIQNARIAIDPYQTVEEDVKKDIDYEHEPTETPLPGLWEMTVQEWNTVFEALGIVLRSWYELPGKLYHYTIFYIAISWDSFVGRDRYVERRSSLFQFPTRTDL